MSALRPARALTIAATFAALAMVATGCSSSNNSSTDVSTPSSSSTASTAAATSAGVAAARAIVAQYLTQKPTISPIPPLSKSVPSGKSVVLIACAEVSCQPAVAGMKDAAAALHWSARVIVSDGTPAGDIQAWQNAVASRPTAISALSGGIPFKTVSSEISEAQKNGTTIGVIGTGPGDLPVGGNSPIVGAVNSPTITAADGRLAGAAVVANAGTGPKVGIVFDQSVSAFAPLVQAATSVIDAAGGSVSIIPAPLADISTTDAQTVANYLRANPDVTYVILTTDDYTTGLQAALATAGLTGKVKIFGTQALPGISLNEVKSGLLTATIIREIEVVGWRSLDQVARAVVGDPIEDNDSTGSLQLVTKQNLAAALMENAETFPYPSQNAIQAAFEAAWKNS
jgi:ribose transport system substrate-binding protein